ncbi:MAG: ABC transporter permease, partial [Burkholderiales bacterium]
MRALFTTFSLRELRHHPWRNAAAVLAVMLGVALSFSVHLINASALSEFSSAVRSVNGHPDLELRAVQGGFDEALYARVAADPAVALASPVLEVGTVAVAADGQRRTLRVVGVDALVVAGLAPALMPVPATDAERMAIFAPGAAFLNPAARQLLGASGAGGNDALRVQTGLQLRALTVAGTVAAGGAPLAVMDLGAAQDFFQRAGQLSRIDLRLREGTDRAAFLRTLQLPPGVTAAEPGDAAERISNLSRAYRVNLTVLALVALFTGAFLVFSVLALSVARRAQQFALLGVLGLTAAQRQRLVLA